MINGLSFDIEDWFQVENLRKICASEKWDTLESRVEQNTEAILEELDRKNQKATFFVLGWVAEKKPKLIKKIGSLGHEVGSHGYGHEIIYNITPQKFREDILKSKNILEGIIGKAIIGYRAPNFSITNGSTWAVEILKEAGFKYDSSIFPTSFHDRYGFQGVNDCLPFNFNNGLKELPITVYKIGKMNFPLGGGAYFRFMPYMIFRKMLNDINIKKRSFIFYLHPWELDDGQPRLKLKLSYYIRHYSFLSKTKGKLRRLLSDFEFAPLRNFV